MQDLKYVAKHPQERVVIIVVGVVVVVVIVVVVVVINVVTVSLLCNSMAMTQRFVASFHAWLLIFAAIDVVDDIDAAADQQERKKQIKFLFQLESKLFWVWADADYF